MMIAKTKVLRRLWARAPIRLFLLLGVLLTVWLLFLKSFQNEDKVEALNATNSNLTNNDKHNANKKNGNGKESYFYDRLDYHLGNMNFSDEIRNETGYQESIVPDIVHYILLDKEFDFTLLISMLSVLRHHRPKFLLLHTNMPSMVGRYWQELLDRNRAYGYTTIKVIPAKRPKYVFGRPLDQVWHAADVLRLRILRQFGGITFDNDVYVVNDLHRYLRFEMTVGWPQDQFIGCQILVAHRNARFLNLYYNSYHNYQGHLWYYNAGELPTTAFLHPRPHLVHRVPHRFGVDTDLVRMLYQKLNPKWQQEFDAIHLLMGHRSYMVENSPDYVDTFDEHNIRTYNQSFGEMARLVYYNTTELLPT